MTVATALEVSWNPLVASNSSTRMKQPIRMAMTAVEDGAKWTSMGGGFRVSLRA